MEKENKIKEIKERIKKYKEEKERERKEHPERFVRQEPYELYGAECMDGWKMLYESVIDEVEKYNSEQANEEDKIKVCQIKEKFGGLRIYLSKYTEKLREMIALAEEMSYNVCEKCGNHIDKSIIKGGWIYPLCENCFNKKAEENNCR